MASLRLALTMAEKYSHVSAYHCTQAPSHSAAIGQARVNHFSPGFPQHVPYRMTTYPQATSGVISWKIDLASSSRIHAREGLSVGVTGIWLALDTSDRI